MNKHLGGLEKSMHHNFDTVKWRNLECKETWQAAFLIL